MSKKIFGKRSIAVLSALAILVSLVAMLGGLSLTSSAAYTPNRTISITSDSSTTWAKMAIINSQKVIGSGVTYTVKGYYKVENFTLSGDVCYGYVCHGTGFSSPKYAIYANTDWTYFEFTGVTSGLEANTDQWLQFGFANAYGTFSLADVTMTNSSGTKIYDMATDTALTTGTHTGFPWQPGMWYFNANSATIGAAGSTGSLTLTASATTVAVNEHITLSCPGATSIVVSRVDGQWSQTYTGSSHAIPFGWAGDYTAYATDGINQSNSVSFTVGASSTAPTFATIGTDKLTYALGSPVIFTMSSDGDANHLWVYTPSNPHGDCFENVGTSYSYIPTEAGQFEALVQTWNGVGNFMSERVSFRVVDPNAPVTNPPTTVPTTEPTTVPTTNPPTTVPTNPPTTVKPTPPATVKPSGNSNPCASGHKYRNGYCIYCAKQDPNWYPCIKGHTFGDNGYCIYCAEPDPDYDICANGHTYQNYVCIYCLAVDPAACENGIHDFQNGVCTRCYLADPNFGNPCANGHDLDETGSCKNCSYYDPDFDPNASTTPSSPNNSNSSNNNGDGSFWLWFWIILILFVIFVVLAVILIANKNKAEDNKSEDDSAAAE